MAADPDQPPRTTLGPFAEQVNQMALVVLAIVLALGMAWLVAILASSGSGPYLVLAFLTVAFSLAGGLAGYTASTYATVVSAVRWAANLGTGILAVVTLGQAPAVPSIALGLIVSGIGYVPRVAVLASAGALVWGSLLVLVLTRFGYLNDFCVAVSAVWMVGAATLVGNGLAEVLGRGAST
jgi:hypothetical protein